MENEVFKKTKFNMDKALGDLKKAFSGLRTGRANTALLDEVSVEYYGASIALNKIANIIIRDARLIEVKPFDKNACGAIEKAILKSNIGITPVNDGTLVRLEVPPLTESRMIEMVKVAKKTQEDHKIELRNIRRDANEDLKKSFNDKIISEDEMRKELEHVQKITDDFIREADKLLEIKTKEIMEI
jgi:ribosome recycling factor